MSTLPMPYGYRGEYTDAETGLQYLRARYYDPKTGVFTQEDTHLHGNLYAYCGGNPVDFVDPSGHCVTFRNTIKKSIQSSGVAPEGWLLGRIHP